jgi:imidazolonepropionase-like amidohydrolase
MSKRFARSLALVLLLAPAVAGPASAQALLQLPEDEILHPRGDLFIQGLDAVWTAAGEVLESSSILIRNGIIEAIGPDLEAPAGVEVLDGRGRTAMPGIVDEHSHTAQIGTNEGSAPIVPEIRVIDALNPSNFGIFRAVSGGVTTARIMHGSSNPIGGQSAVIKMRWGVEDSRQLLVPGAPRAVKFALGENVTRKPAQARGPATRFPASRPGVEALYTQAFSAAREYRDLQEAYRADPSSFRAPPRRDLRLEALVDIMEDRIRIHAHSYRADEILMLMRVAERFGFTIENFTHILEGYRIADELREHGTGASTFSDWWQFKLESYDAIPYNATLMHERGVLTALNSDLAWIQPFMKWEITKPVQYGGASKEDALRMLTINPAIMLGIEDKVGSLEVGKQGDVVLLTGDPFDAFSRIEYTVIDGIVYFDSNREAESRGEPINPLPAGNDRYVVDDADGLRASSSPPGGASSAVAQSVAPQELEPVKTRAETIALVGATIHPVSRPAIEDGVLVMQGGRIQAVGPRGQVEIPADARRVDVSGRHLYPGMIDPVTHLGLFEIGAISQATDRNELGTFNPHVRALGAYQPHGRAPAVARARGITSVLTAQTGGMIEGMGSVVDLEGDTFERAEIRGEAVLLVNLPVPSGGGGGGWGGGPGWGVLDEYDHDHAVAVEWAGDALFTETGAFDLGESGHSAMAGGTGATTFPAAAAARVQSAPREPSMDTGRMQELADFFERAREYAAGGGVARRADEPFEANVWGGDAVVLDAMLPVMRGEIPVFFRADSEWQIRHVLLFLQEFPEVGGVVVGGVEAFRVSEELAEQGVPVILTRTRNPTPDRNDSVAASQRNAAILHEAGVRVAFGTNESADVRNLPEHVALAVAHGLPPQVGLESVTLRPAELLGLGAEIGSLDAGKRADVLVTDGNPLQQLTRIETMFIGGIEVDPRDNDHSRAYERFRQRVW